MYLPTRSGCTDIFKEALDSLCVIVDMFSGRAFFLGDFNADPGNSLGGGGLLLLKTNKDES